MDSKRSPWALSAVAVCGGCGANINAHQNGTGRRRVLCAGRTQGNGCDEPSCYADIIEDQIGEVLAGFAVPESERSGLLAAWRHYQERDMGADVERQRLQRRLSRLKDLYLDGDLSRAEYHAERAAVADKLASLPAEADPEGDVGERLATFLANVASAWAMATPAERNKLARHLFAKVVIRNRTAVAVVPRPDLRPFFFVLPQVEGVNSGEKVCTGGSDGGRFSTFRTCRADSRGFRSRTFVSSRRVRLGGPPCLTRLPAVGITPARANSPQANWPRSTIAPRPGVCAPWPPTSASATRRFGPWFERGGWQGSDWSAIT